MHKWKFYPGQVKRMMKKYLVLLLLLLALLPGQGAYAEENWEYRVDGEGYARLTAYIGEDAEMLSVPAQVDGYWVKGMDGEIFLGAPSLKSISIPGTVQEMDENAFSGRRDVTIRAYNGSAALTFAGEKGMKSVNRSRLEFTEGVIDLTGIVRSDYSYVTNGVRLLNIYAARMEEGSLFYMPPDSKNSLGEAYEVRALEKDGDYTIVTMAKAAPSLALERLQLDEALYVDFSRIQVIDNSLTDIRFSAPKGVMENDRFNGTLSATLNIDNWTGTLELKAENGYLMLDMDMMPFSFNAMELRMNLQGSVEVGYETSTPVKTFERTLAYVPVFSASGLVNGSFALAVSGEADGRLSLKFGYGGALGISYSKAKGWDHYFYPSSPSLTVNVAASAEVDFFLPKMTFDVPLVGEIGYVGYRIEAKLEAEAAAELLPGNRVNCAELCYIVDHGIEAAIGLCDWKKLQDENLENMFQAWENGGDEMDIPELDLPYWEFNWNFNPLVEKQIRHVENGVIVEECTQQGLTLEFDTGYEKTLLPIFCPEKKAIIPDAYRIMTRPGYEFKGWYYVPSGADETEQAYHGDLLTENPTVLYAYWEEAERDDGYQSDYVPDIQMPNLGTLQNRQYAYYAGSQYPNVENPGHVRVSIHGSQNGYVPIPPSSAWEYLGNYSSISFFSGALSYSTFSSLSWEYGMTSTEGASCCPYLTSISWPSSMTDIGTYTYCPSLTSVKLPPYIEYIAYHAFYGCTGLKSVDMGACIYLLDVEMDGCPNLETVILPPNITRISRFREMENLKSIEIPASVLTIGPNAFSGSGLESIQIPEGVVDCYGAFVDCDHLLSANIPATTLESSHMYENCDRLASVTLHEGLPIVGDYAFWKCYALEQVTFPENAIEIRPRAFWECTSLQEITLHSCTIQEAAFENCSNLKTVTIYADSDVYIGPYAFANTPLLESVNIIGSANVVIDEKAFFGSGIQYLTIETTQNVSIEGLDSCLNLDTLNVTGNQVTALAPKARIRYASLTAADQLICKFGGSELEEADLSANTIVLYDSAFACSALERLQLTGVVYLWGNQIFYGSGLREISFEVYDSVITDLMFAECVRLEKVELTGKLKNGLEDRVFSGCINLKEVILPDVESEWTGTIGEYAFQNCKALERVELGEGYGWIQPNAFRECYHLKEVVLPDTLESIDSYAFENCIHLEEINLPPHLKSLNNSAFEGCGFVMLKLPASLEWIGNRAFADCQFLRLVEFKSGETGISGSFDRDTWGEGAFAGCQSLERVICPSGSSIEGMAGEYGLLAGALGQESYTLRVMTNLNQGTITVQARPGQLIYPDKLIPYVIPQGYYADVNCQEEVPYPYEMPDHDAAIYMVCTFNWPTAPGEEGSTVEGNTLTDCSVEGYYYVINGVTALGEGSIGPGITDLHLPTVIDSIDPLAFARASGLIHIFVMPDNPFYQSIGGMLYDRNGKLLFCPRNLQEVYLPEGTAGIAANAFRCEGGSLIRKLTIPDGVSYAEEGAFDALSGAMVYGPLSGAVKEEAVRAGIAYNQYAISYRSGNEILGVMTCGAGELLPAVASPERGGSRFLGWSLSENGEKIDLASFTMPRGDLMLYAVWGEETADISWLEFPAALTALASESMAGTGMEAVWIHEGIRTVESRAFAHCMALRYVKIVSRETVLAEDAFAECDLEALTIYAPENSPAHAFALEKGIKWQALD